MGIAYNSKAVRGLQCEKRGRCCLLIHRLLRQDTRPHTHTVRKARLLLPADTQTLAYVSML